MSPAGGFDPARLAHSRLKKRMVGWIDRMCLRKANAVHATVPAEAEWIRAFEPRAGKIVVAPPGIPGGAGDAVNAGGDGGAAGPLKALYLGRRHPLKGIDLLEEAAKGLDVELRIEDSVFGAEKEAAFAWCDVLCLPTRSDNFGLVVVEALARGKPVVTTRGAPAWAEIAGRGCGWYTDVSAAAIRAALSEAAALPRAELAAMGRRGREWVARDFSWGKTAKAIEEAI